MVEKRRLSRVNSGSSVGSGIRCLLQRFSVAWDPRRILRRSTAGEISSEEPNTHGTLGLFEPVGFSACSRLVERGTSDTTGNQHQKLDAPRQRVPAQEKSRTIFSAGEAATSFGVGRIFIPTGGIARASLNPRLHAVIPAGSKAPGRLIAGFGQISGSRQRP